MVMTWNKIFMFLVTFHAVNQDIMLYWMGENADEDNEVRVWVIRKGDSFQESTYPGHIFRTYNAYNKDEYKEHQIDANFGEHKHIHVELLGHGYALFTGGVCLSAFCSFT